MPFMPATAIPTPATTFVPISRASLPAIRQAWIMAKLRRCDAQAGGESGHEIDRLIEVENALFDILDRLGGRP